MKKHVLAWVPLCSLIWAFSAAAQASAPFKNDEEKLNYILGRQIATSLQSDNLPLNKAILLKSLEDGLNGKPSLVTAPEAQTFMRKYMETKQKEKGSSNLEAGRAFLEKNQKEAGVVTLPSGLQYKVLSEGKGAKPKATDTVTVDYEGTLIDGKVFDSSYKRGQPVSFPLNGVIRGWTEALQLMSEGSTWMLYLPENLAYGAQSPSPLIGSHSTLIFKVHLISILPPAKGR